MSDGVKIKNIHHYNDKKDDILLLLQEMLDVAILLVNQGDYERGVEFLEKYIQWMKRQNVDPIQLVPVMEILANVYREVHGDLKKAVKIMQQVRPKKQELLQRWKKQQAEIAKLRDVIGKTLSSNRTKHLQQQKQAQLLTKIAKCDQELLRLQRDSSSMEKFLQKQAQRQKYVQQLQKLR
jgi:hypothetical protein